jgi:hypothetical protein
MRRITVVPLFVVAAIAAVFIVPASASAAEWMSGGKGLKGPAAIELNGSLGVEALGSSVGCSVSGSATLLPGDKGEITKLNFTNCLTAGGTWKKCKVQSTTSKLPITIQARSKDILFNNLNWTWNFSGGECALKQWSIVGAGEVTAIPDSLDFIHSMQFPISTTVTINETTNIGLKTGSAFNVLPSGTYGINP